jgi:hypothetical protein
MAALGSSRYVTGMAVAKIDLWVGKTLFVPPIVKLCQLTRQSQYAVSRLFWFIAALDGLYRAETLFGSLVWGGLSLVMMLSAAWRADTPTSSFRFFRMLALALLILDLAGGAVTGEWAGAAFWVFVLFAEYAAIIRTIPPRESRRAAAKASAAK